MADSEKYIDINKIAELKGLKSNCSIRIAINNPKTLNSFDNNIVFQNVNFEYVKDHPALKNLNLNVAKNESIAIVGNSGGGKFTIVNLIPRFYDIKSGTTDGYI